MMSQPIETHCSVLFIQLLIVFESWRERGWLCFRVQEQVDTVDLNGCDDLSRIIFLVVFYTFPSYCYTLLMHKASMSFFSAEDISSCVSGVFFSLICLCLSLLLLSSLYLLIHLLESRIKEIMPFLLITGLGMLDLSLSSQNYPELLIVDFVSW